MDNIIRSSLPPLPDPGQEITKFLSWLKKRSAVKQLRFCLKKCEQMGLNLDDIIKHIGKKNLHITRDGSGNEVVHLADTVWADKWMTFYDLEVPHHGKPKKL